MVKEYKQFSEMEIKMYVRKVCTTSLIIKEEQLKTESSIIFLLSQIKNFDSIHFGDFESEGEGKQAQCSSLRPLLQNGAPKHNLTSKGNLTVRLIPKEAGWAAQHGKCTMLPIKPSNGQERDHKIGAWSSRCLLPSRDYKTHRKWLPYKV
jgi:hypothetical protein